MLDGGQVDRNGYVDVRHFRSYTTDLIKEDVVRLMDIKRKGGGREEREEEDKEQDGNLRFTKGSSDHLGN